MLILFGVFLITNLIAQEGSTNDCKYLIQLKSELKTHFDTKVHPNLKVTHDELISQLDDRDKKMVIALRQKQKLVKAERMAMRKIAKKVKASGKDIAVWKKANKAKIEKNNKHQKEINDKLKELSTKNKTAILASYNKLIPQNKVWKEERQKIKKTYSQYECVQEAKITKNKRGSKEEGIKLRKSKRNIKRNKKKIVPKQRKIKANPRGKARMHQAAAFLLWDATGKKAPTLGAIEGNTESTNDLDLGFTNSTEK